MQQRNLRKDMWDTFSPIVLQIAVAFVVELIVVYVCYMQYLPELASTSMTQERINEIIIEITEKINPYITEISALSALVTIPFLALMMNSDRNKERKAGFISNKRAPLAQYIYVPIIGFAFSLGLNNILLLSNLAEHSESYQETAEILYSPSFPVQILCVGIIIPIMEEMIFRGLIYRRMRHNVSMWKAMMFSALMFGFYHGNSVQFVYAFLSGILLAYLYEKYGSIKAPVLAHMLMNIVSCVLTEVDVFTWIFANVMRVTTITVACAAIASTMFVLINKINEKPETIEMTNEPQDVVDGQ